MRSKNISKELEKIMKRAAYKEKLRRIFKRERKDKDKNSEELSREDPIIAELSKTISSNTSNNNDEKKEYRFDLAFPDPEDVKFTEEEQAVIEQVKEKLNKYGITPFNPWVRNALVVERIFKKLDDALKKELVTHEIAYEEGIRIRFRGEEQCVLKFFAHEEDYPSDVHDEILDCIYKLHGDIRVSTDNKVIAEDVLVGLVNHDWISKRPFIRTVREIKESMSSLVGQEEAVEQLLNCYNVLVHTHKSGPHVIRIKAGDGMGVDTLVKTFASAIGRFCELSCQNLGLDPEATAGSSRIYYNSVPGDLAYAIINNNVQVVILKNVNDADKRNIARLSAFFENTFVDNHFRVRVPGDVLVICTESKSGKKTPEYLFKDAYTVELKEYSDSERRRIADSIITSFNTEFGLDINFDATAMGKIIELGSPSKMRRKLLDVFSNISYENELAPDERVVRKKTITSEDLI